VGGEHLREAVGVVAGSPARLEHAKTLAAPGTRRRRARRVPEVRELLGHACELAGIRGATGLVDHVRWELAGSRPRTTALKGVEALTASEPSVVNMGADGARNREIAQTLFVTAEPVQAHLRRRLPQARDRVAARAARRARRLLADRSLRGVRRALSVVLAVCARLARAVAVLGPEEPAEVRGAC
jgi:DNA-binding CsgD family transcriptional regulator